MTSFKGHISYQSHFYFLKDLPAPSLSSPGSKERLVCNLALSGGGPSSVQCSLSPCLPLLRRFASCLVTGGLGLVFTRYGRSLLVIEHLLKSPAKTFWAETPKYSLSLPTPSLDQITSSMETSMPFKGVSTQAVFFSPLWRVQSFVKLTSGPHIWPSLESNTRWP